MKSGRYLEPILFISSTYYDSQDSGRRVRIGFGLRMDICYTPCDLIFTVVATVNKVCVLMS